MCLGYSTCNVQHALFLNWGGLLGGDRDVAGLLRCWCGGDGLGVFFGFHGRSFFLNHGWTRIYTDGGVWLVGDVPYRLIMCVAVGRTRRSASAGIGSGRSGGTMGVWLTEWGSFG